MNRLFSLFVQFVSRVSGRDRRVFARRLAEVIGGAR